MFTMIRGLPQTETDFNICWLTNYQPGDTRSIADDRRCNSVYGIPMTRDEFNTFCATLPATTHVVQWGNSDVWKVGGKVFALCGWHEGEDAFTFKASELAFEVLQEAPGIRPAPYLASRGLKWLQHYKSPGLSDAELQAHIRASYDMVISGLTKKKRAELGL